MPRSRQAARSVMSVPVAATAIIFRSGNWARSAARSGTLLVMAIVAPASRKRATASPARVAGYSAQRCSKAGRRILAMTLSRSRKTMLCGAFIGALIKLQSQFGRQRACSGRQFRQAHTRMVGKQFGHPFDKYPHFGGQVAVLRIHHMDG